jgi:uncharacterized protein (TIGR00251 family)
MKKTSLPPTPYILHVWAKPGSQHTKVERWFFIKDKFYLKVRVKSPPTQGKANEDLRKILAGFFQIPSHTILLVQGKKSPLKKFIISADLPKESLPPATMD